MFWTFGTTKLDKEYTTSDLKRVVPLKNYGLDERFYGGRVHMIGETGTDILLLLENRDGLKVIDLGAVKLENIDPKFLRLLCKRRKLNYGARTSKEELIELLQGKNAS